MGKTVKIILAIAAIVVGVATGQTWLIAVGVSGLSSILTKKPTLPSTAIAVEYNGTLEPTRGIFGQMRVSGMNLIPSWTSGTRGEYLHQALLLSGWDLDSITDVYLDQTTVASANIGAITVAATDGQVTTGDYANNIHLRRYTGSQTTVDYILNNAFSSKWGTNHVLKNCGVLFAQFKHGTIYEKKGKPELSCLVTGARVYDPRLDSTNGGSGAHRYATPSTWTYSNNAALCVGFFLMWDKRYGGYGVPPATGFDWALVAAAANECDENVTVPSGTQKRYTCNVVIELTKEARRSNLELLTGAMLGHAYQAGGKWRIYAGSWQSAAFSISEADVTDGLVFQTAVDVAEHHNAVKGSYIDSARNYTPQEFAPVKDTAYQTEDGVSVPIFKEVSFGACTNEYEAQRDAIIINRLSRRRRTLTVSGGMSLLKIRPYETGTVTISEWGLSAWTCRAERIEVDPVSGQVQVTLRQASSADWGDPTSPGDYTTQTVNASPTAGDMLPEAPTGLTATSFPQEIRLSITLPTTYVAGSVVEVWEYTANTPFASATKLGEWASNFIIVPKRDTTTRYYWVRVKTAQGRVSTEYPSGNGVAGVGDNVLTGDINANAATETFTATAAGPNTVTAVAGGGSVSAFIAKVTHTAAVDSVAVCKVVTDSSSSDGAGDLTGYSVAARCERLSSPYTNASGSQLPDSTIAFTSTAQVQMSLLAGIQYDIGLYVSALDNGITNNVVTCNRSYVSVEIIKR